MCFAQCPRLGGSGGMHPQKNLILNNIEDCSYGELFSI